MITFGLKKQLKSNKRKTFYIKTHGSREKLSLKKNCVVLMPSLLQKTQTIKDLNTGVKDNRTIQRN